MGRGELKKLIMIIVLTIIINSTSNLFVLRDLYTLGIIIVSTILLMLIFDYKENTLEKNVNRFKINIFLVSTLLSLTKIFETLSNFNSMWTMESVALGFKPMVIGVYIYIVFINLVQGYVKKDSGSEIVIEDEIVIKTSIIKELDLTRRESEIFELLLEDLPNKDIAEQLYIAETTVKKHVQNILKKCECGNRLELIEKYKGVS